MTTELVTQIVILLTALVGLYKAATYHPPDSKKSDAEDGKKERMASDVFDALLSYAGIFGFMLIMPAFVWVFSAITSNIGSSSSNEEEPTPQYMIEYQVPDEPSRMDMELVAASSVPYRGERGEALAKVAERAIAACELEIAIAAAGAVPYRGERGEALEKVLSSIQDGQCDKPNHTMQPTAEAAAD